MMNARDLWYAVARSGSLPKVLTRVHPVYRTPVNTIILQWLVNLVTGLLLLWWLGVVNGYFYEIFVAGLAVLIIYAMGNRGSLRPADGRLLPIAGLAPVEGCNRIPLLFCCFSL